METSSHALRSPSIGFSLIGFSLGRNSVWGYAFECSPVCGRHGHGSLEGTHCGILLWDSLNSRGGGRQLVLVQRLGIRPAVRRRGHGVVLTDSLLLDVAAAVPALRCISNACGLRRGSGTRTHPTAPCTGSERPLNVRCCSARYSAC